ncbi:MAG: type II restriction endonuclease subunit M [Deltaproteobacteria bacterium]|nr:type II restriction endonuclease subunit M [Deltaproteobacteria bacterium]
MTVFIRVLDASVDEKADAIRTALTAPHVSVAFEQAPEKFTAIPGSPFAYWAPSSCLQIFTTSEPFNRTPRLVVSTNPLNADFRFARVWWEPKASTLGGAWRPWAKGGAYSPHYYDVNTVIAWSDDRQSYTGFLGTENRPLERPASVQHFFRPGMTWPRRTQGGLGIRAMPAGCIFADKGPAAFVEGDGAEDLLALLAVTTSTPFRYLVALQMAFGSYEVGVLQRTPVPNLDKTDVSTLAVLSRRAWSLKRWLDTHNETSHAFVLPMGLNEKVSGRERSVVEREIGALVLQVDDAMFVLYGINADDRTAIESSVKRAPLNEGEQEAESDDESDDASEDDTLASADSFSSWLVGVAFGRFDPRLATGERAVPPEPEPFDPLPSRSPGMYPEGEEPAERPDILVDDEGHADDLAARAISIAERVKVDAPENFRAWLAKEFFPLHIKMYSKSRRKAPIYWQLATPSASYSVWLYIHAFSKDTLFRVQNDYVTPRLAHEERRVESLASELRDGATAAQRKQLAAQEGLVEELRAFLDEVKRVAPLWKPNLDDGVVINFAPLWRLVPQNKSWQKELKSTWDALGEGKYDWAHLALHLWPERVVPKCAKDRSLAIAHGLEDVFWVEGTDGKWTARKTPTKSVDELVKERTSPAVKSALKSLLEAPVASGKSTGRNGGGRRKAAAATEGGDA